MDRLIVARKLDSLRRCIDRVRVHCPADVAELVGDPDLQDIVVLNLSRAAPPVGATSVAMLFKRQRKQSYRG